VFYKFLLKYYDNGQIESKSKFMMSKTNGMNLNGKTTFWYRSGQKLGEGNYKEGKSDGMWTWWNNKGQRVENANFKDGDLLNKTIFKYSYFTGRLKSEKNYIDGKCISGC